VTTREPRSPTSPLDRAALPDEDAVQMQKDFQRETVVVGGVAVQGGDLEARVREHCSGLRAVDDASAVFPPQRPEAAQALAKAALRAVWRTRVGLDAWDRVRTHLEGRRAAEAATEAHVAEVMSSTSSKAPSLCDGSTVQASDDDDVSDAEDHALVSRPTEPPTTIDAFVDGRVVCTAYSHLSEVRCDGAGKRSFMHVAVRTTFRFNASVELSSERDIIFVALDEAARENALDCAWAAGFGPIDVACQIRIDEAGLVEGGPGPRATFIFHDKTTLTVTAETASEIHRFVARPALCEYVPQNRVHAPDAALLMVANSPAYLMRLWPQFLNKLLYASDANLRAFIWVGELPPQLAKPTDKACLVSLPAKLARKGVDARTVSWDSLKNQRRLAARGQSYYDGRYHMPSDVTFVSNHYVKMPATLATLSAPGITDLYYVDLDAVVAHPWVLPQDLLEEHLSNKSDVSFGITSELRWKVHGSRFYVRDSVPGRAFFARWFTNRCTFKDQYSLWHTILQTASGEGCLEYKDELYEKFTYRMAKHVKLDRVVERYPFLGLTCEKIDVTCPGLRFSNTGGPKCRPGLHASPKLLPQIFHHGAPNTFPLKVVYGGRPHALVVESACFEGRRRDGAR